MKHYVAPDEQATTDEVFEKQTPTLRRTTSHTTTGQGETGESTRERGPDGGQTEG